MKSAFNTPLKKKATEKLNRVMISEFEDQDEVLKHSEVLDQLKDERDFAVSNDTQHERNQKKPSHRMLLPVRLNEAKLPPGK